MKRTEKQLYGTWLDLKFADSLNNDCLSDWLAQIKDMRKHRNKTKRLLKTAAEVYRKVYGQEPKIR